MKISITETSSYPNFAFHFYACTIGRDTYTGSVHESKCDSVVTLPMTVPLDRVFALLDLDGLHTSEHCDYCVVSGFCGFHSAWLFVKTVFQLCSRIRCRTALSRGLESQPELPLYAGPASPDVTTPNTVRQGLFISDVFRADLERASAQARSFSVRNRCRMASKPSRQADVSAITPDSDMSCSLRLLSFVSASLHQTRSLHHGL
ncbi:hypothetical protein [Kushneria aurantia]|uniref:Uncharacterized protein n=1 Tax=Kushneria aurantia TaxID=504092 RepID=A0ABV6G2R5_9GAMM|nr:hypothetical protein [Kushneria aurantia]